MMGNFSRFGDYGPMSDLSRSWGLPFGTGFGAGLFLAPFILILLAWTLYWKYRALWHAAKHDDKWWFIAMLVVNTVGILEILYLYVFSKKASLSGHDEKNVPMVPPQI